MLAHVFPARADAYGFSEPRKPRHLPFGKHVPVSDVVSAVNFVRRFGISTRGWPCGYMHSSKNATLDRYWMLLLLSDTQNYWFDARRAARRPVCLSEA